MKGRARAAGLAAAFAMAVTGPAAAQTAPAAAAAANLPMAVAAPVTSLDPHHHQLSPNNAVADMVFGRLVGLDAQSRAQDVRPAAAR